MPMRFRYVRPWVCSPLNSSPHAHTTHHTSTEAPLPCLQAHFMRNPDTRACEAHHALSKMSGKVLALTGTVVVNKGPWGRRKAIGWLNILRREAHEDPTIPQLAFAIWVAETCLELGLPPTLEHTEL